MSTALRCASFFLLAGALFAEDAAPKLDYLFFKEQVQPIFLEKRIGHARCVACHTARSPMLQKLSPGAKTWDDEQSRKNFEMWSLFVAPGKPMSSKLMLHPLAEEAVGDAFHGGGKQKARLLRKPGLIGRSRVIRTLDPLLPKQVRYQAALYSVRCPEPCRTAAI